MIDEIPGERLSEEDEVKGGAAAETNFGFLKASPSRTCGSWT